MITWSLWRALQTPYVAHPIYQLRVLRNQRISSSLGWSERFFYRRPRLWTGVGLLALIAIPVFFGFSILFLLICGPVFFIIFIIIPALIVIVGTFYGLATALAVSDSIANEKAQGRYTLMTLTPQGIAGATWALCSLVFHTNFLLTQVRRTISNIYLSVSLIVVFTIYPFLPIIYPTIPGVLPWGVLLLVLIFDYIQSANTGCLVGMIVPSFADSRATTRSSVLAIFLTLQFATYLLISFLCLVLWPYLRLVPVGQRLDFALLCFVTYYLCRDGIIGVLLLILAKRLNTTIDEWNELIHIRNQRMARLPVLFRRVTRSIRQMIH